MTAITDQKDKAFCIPEAFEEAVNFFNLPLLAFVGFGLGLIVGIEALLSHPHKAMWMTGLAALLVAMLIFLYAGLVRMMIARQSGAPLNPLRAIFKAPEQALSLFFVFILTALLTDAGMILLIIPGLIIGALFLLADQCVVRLGIAPWTAFRKAVVLSRGYRLAFAVIVAIFLGIELFAILVARLLHLWYSTEASLGFGLVVIWCLLVFKAAVAVAAYRQIDLAD